MGPDWEREEQLTRWPIFYQKPRHFWPKTDPLVTPTFDHPTGEGRYQWKALKPAFVSDTSTSPVTGKKAAKLSHKIPRRIHDRHWFHRILAKPLAGFYSSHHHLPFPIIHSYRGSQFAVDRPSEDSRIWELDPALVLTPAPLNSARPEVSNPNLPVAALEFRSPLTGKGI